MNTYELIDAAADLIESTGWTQGANARDAKGRATWAHPQEGVPAAACYCAHGALCRILRSSDWNDPSERERVIENAIVTLGKANSSQNLISYNDTTGRTKEEVLTLMRSTANTLRTIDQGVTA